MSTDELVFLDTNVLVYVYDESYPDKQRQAREIMSRGGFVLSPQVMGEFYVTVTRKLAQPLSVAQAATAMEALGRSPVVPITSAEVKTAVETATRYQLSYWDGLIVATAEAAHCPILLTEDLTDGQVIRGVRIENPFRDL
jgi:predicted nucleic acid-binding protein